MADRFDDATQVRSPQSFFNLNSNDAESRLQKELQTFLEREQAQARVQQSIHTFTSMCWDKCVLNLFLFPSRIQLTIAHFLLYLPQMHHWYPLDAVLSR